MRRLSVLFTCLPLVIFLSLLVACGGTSSNTGNNASNSPASPPNAGNGAGSGSAGSGSGSGGSGSSGSGSASGSSSVSYVYTASASTISGYGVGSNGSLTAVSGSPYSSSTAQGTNIVTNGGNLYAIAAGNTNLDIFSINKSNGSLTPASGASATTGDPNPGDPAQALALDHSGTSLYVNVGVTNQNGGINAFTVGSGSSAQQFQFLSTGATAFPPLVFSPDDQYAYSNTCFFRTEGVHAFTRASDGTLKGLSLGPVTEPTVTGAAFCPGALAVSAKGYLAVVWVQDLMCCGSSENHVYVMTYKINGDGTLTAISGSQQQTASTADSSSANSVAANFDPSGSVLAMTGNGGIQTYSLDGNGTLAPAGSPQNAGVKFQKIAWDNSNHVFATDSSNLYVFNSSSGMLSPASGSPYAGGQALTVLPLQ
jgi:6-phosphogluconolactonase (cycloisomerase 2 family)